MAKKTSGLNISERQIVLKKLVQFHARVQLERFGEYKARFSRGIYNTDKKEIFDMHYDSVIPYLANEILPPWPHMKKWRFRWSML